MNITKQKQTHRYREQTNGYQWGEGREERQYTGRGLRGTNYYPCTIYPCIYIVQHKEYSSENCRVEPLITTPSYNSFMTKKKHPDLDFV